MNDLSWIYPPQIQYQSEGNKDPHEAEIELICYLSRIRGTIDLTHFFSESS